MEPWVLSIASEGLKFEFNRPPPEPYFEQYNLSAQQNMSNVQEKVKEWEAEGAVIRVQHPPPLSVSIETNNLGEVIKKRPCIDLSRSVNKYLPEIKTKLETLAAKESLISKNCFKASFDLRKV